MGKEVITDLNPCAEHEYQHLQKINHVLWGIIVTSQYLFFSRSYSPQLTEKPI
jgi:hypothetical protein